MTVNTEIIEDDIVRIRQRMEQRFDQLNHDVQPSQLIQGLLSNGNSSANENANLLLEKAKANPVAAAVAGVGLLGLFLAKQSSSGAADLRGDTSDAAQRVGDHVSDIGTSSKETAQQLKTGVMDVASKAGDVSAAAKRKAKAASAAASETLSEAAQSAVHSAKRAPVQIKAQTESATDWVKENPVPAGLMALAVGAAISSFFTAKSGTSRLEASKKLHEEARHNPSVPAAKKAPKRKATKTKTAAKKLKPKPIPTRLAKARNMQGKPDTAVKAAVASQV